MVRRIIEIDRDKCNGCGACADVCPQKLVHMVPDDASNFVPCSRIFRCLFSMTAFSS